MRLALILGFIGSGLAAYAAIPEPVSLDSGKITGTSASGGDVRVFKGIPFAAPPVGDLRWKSPQPVAHWDGARAGDHFGHVCMQNQQPNATPSASEDCLYLNVWTAANSASERRPVILWSYGGGFYLGSGSQAMYDGEALARKGAVVVTFNYRVGMLGFFSHPELAKESGRNSSGNYGMMDMAAALRWVQKNITAFGGDPNRVTIDGESAGSVMVAAMVGSPEGKGLFKRAISQSGAFMGISISKTITQEKAQEDGKALAAKLGATTLAELRAKPAEEVLKTGGNGEGLVVDGWYIPEDMAAIFAKGKQNPVDVLVGSNQDEGTFFVRPGSTNAQEFLTKTRTRFGDMADGYLKTHPASSDTEAQASSLSAVRDEMGWHMREYAQIQTKRGNKAYLYYFTHVPPSAPGQASRGASHTAEIRYMFNTLDPRTPLTETDHMLADAMTSYWVNFAATGNPNGTLHGKALPEWPAFDEKKHPQPMVLGDHMGVGYGIDSTVLAFFDGFYAKQSAKP